MPRLSSRRSEGSETELDGIAEQELVRLQQEYRVMEGDRKAYSEESQNIIRKQREAISVLQAENEELMKENRLAGSQQNQTNDAKNIEKLSALLKGEVELKAQVHEVKENIAKQEQEIHQMEKRIAQQRKHMGGVYMSQAKYVVVHKQIRVLENRLDQANKKFNQDLADNKDLREEIDHMRTERTIFQGLYKKLQKKLNDNKEEIAKVILDSTSFYDVRDDAQNKMIALKEKSDKELLQYNMELKELMRIIDHDKKLKEFMNIKSEDRAEMHGLSLQYAHKRGEERDGDKEDTIQSYEAAFDKIKETTNIDDLQLLVGKFIETEDKNFALFNYVNELNNEIELLQEQIIDIEQEIKQFNQESLNMDEQRQRILDDLEEQYKKTNEELEVHNQGSLAARKILNELKGGINSLFTKINCDPSTIVDMLGGHEGITDSNMMQYLGIIEQRTNELIQVQAFINSQQDAESSPTDTLTLLGKGPLPTSNAITIQPPATIEEYDSDFSANSDDENRPLSQNELKQRILRGMTKREGAGQRKSLRHNSTAEHSLDEKSNLRKARRISTKER